MQALAECRASRAKVKEIHMTKVARALVAAAGVFTLVGTALSGPALAAEPVASIPHLLPSTGIVAAPVRVVATADGAVGYREIGSGTPLLLIMGLGGTMNDWSPSFVNALAAQHEVVVFDNAGVGKTAAIASPLSITAMAKQTSALISALHLGPTSVLGWSMGGMIAQALAVLHPSQVSKLVLSATQAGNGQAAAPGAVSSAAASSDNPEAVLSVLFPPSASATARLYALSILRYPELYTVPPNVKAAQVSAIDRWFVGSDATGQEVGSLRVPTLVADGTQDALDPVSNDRQLAGLIKGAQLALYPGAGHAFWFQDEPSFVSRLGAFLG
jgi:pimeloyl-ACP methyl ester carboxylesterase